MNLRKKDFGKRVITILDFCQGKAEEIVTDVVENDNEYLILKNKTPEAVLISFEKYKMFREKIEKVEIFLEHIEDMRLLQIAESRNCDNFTSFEDLIINEGFSLEEIEKIAENIKIE